MFAKTAKKKYLKECVQQCTLNLFTTRGIELIIFGLFENSSIKVKSWFVKNEKKKYS